MGTLGGFPYLRPLPASLPTARFARPLWLRRAKPDCAYAGRQSFHQTEVTGAGRRGHGRREERSRDRKDPSVPSSASALSLVLLARDHACRRGLQDHDVVDEHGHDHGQRNPLEGDAAEEQGTLAKEAAARAAIDLCLDVL